jgi:hypothetical protein
LRALLLSLTAGVLLLLTSSTGARAESWNAQAVVADQSSALSSIPRQPPHPGHGAAVRHRGNAFQDIALSARDRAQLQTSLGPGTAPSTSSNWEGVNNLNAVIPPDTTGDVGLNAYVQWVNLSFQIRSKSSGANLYGPAAGNTLWSGFGSGTPASVCATTNQGDVQVNYDRRADRWVFAQFAFNADRWGTPVAPYYECFAVSTTNDPTGSYYRYAFQVNAPAHPSYFPDYPKLGIWPSGYYLTTNNFNGNTFVGPGIYAFDRTKMLAGDASASFIAEQLPSQYEGLLPAHADGPSSQQPPSGTPEYIGAVDTSDSLSPGTGTGNKVQIWTLQPNFATSSATLAGPVTLSVDPYTFAFCGQVYAGACIPQPGTSQTLDPLADRLMQRLQYRNFGSYASLVASHTVNVGSSGSDQAGIRWYEIRYTPSTGTTPTLSQQSTFAPADGVNRWMGGAAIDGSGDIALGYSASSTSVYPSIRYTGRLAGDAPGQMTQGEGVLANGSGSQTGYARWGDYSAMSVDPSDDSTFWYTQEYYAGTSAAGWQTRVGAFRLAATPPKNTSPPTISGTAAQGRTLTANPGSWSGTQPISYAYQWQTCAASCSNITGATSSTYTLQSTDVGNYIQVAVTANNQAGSSGPLNSAQVGPVQPPPTPPSNTASPTISGSTIDGQTLTASPGSWSGTQPISYAYQWQTCTSSTSCSNVTGATGSTYKQQSSDVGHYIQVLVTATNSASSASATSGKVGPVAAAPPANISAPTVSGSPTVGQTLTANPGSWSGTQPIGYAYQWQDCAVTCQPIMGATSSTYKVQSTDVNNKITVTVKASNSGGTSSASAAQIGPVTAQPIANGGFETGTFAGWTIGGNAPTPSISTSRVHSGSYSALLGYTGASGEPTGDSSIQQQFTVPAAGATLSFNVWEFTTDTVRWDWQTCQLRTPSGSTLATIFREAGNGQAWQPKSYSLSSWKGQNVVIWCNVHEDGWGDQTYMYVDDFAVN